MSAFKRLYTRFSRQLTFLDPLTGLTESMRAAQIDPAIESISGSPMPIHETKAYTQMEARTSLSEVHFSPSNTSGIDNLHRAVSENSSPSSDRLNAIRNSPNWRGDGQGKSVTFVRQSTTQPDDPFVSSEGTIEATTGGMPLILIVFNHRSNSPSWRSF